MVKKRSVKKVRKVVAEKGPGGPVEFRFGDNSTPKRKNGMVEVKVGRGIKIVIQESAIKEAVDRVVPVVKEALQAITNTINPMNDDELQAFIDKKKKECATKTEGDGQDGTNVTEEK